MINIKVCKSCTKEFIPTPGSKGVYCSRTCQHSDQGNISRAIADKKREVIVNQYLTNPAKCVNCSVALSFEKRKYKFCSQSCGAVHNNSKRVVDPEFIIRQRERALANPSGFAATKLGGAYRKGIRRAERVLAKCKTCGSEFESLKSDPRRFCSKVCIKTGGVREGSGRAKTGYYKGIYCGSTYELAFLIWHLDHSSNIQRCKTNFSYTHNNKQHTYHPDFEVDGLIYEIKGRVTEVDYVKVATCNAIMVCGDDITKYLTYVSNTYNVPKGQLWLLYDDKIEKTCNNCGNVFQPKTKAGIYCSRSCSLKANRLLDPRRVK